MSNQKSDDAAPQPGPAPVAELGAELRADDARKRGAQPGLADSNCATCGHPERKHVKMGGCQEAVGSVPLSENRAELVICSCDLFVRPGLAEPPLSIPPRLLDAIGRVIQEAKHHHRGKGQPLSGPGGIPTQLAVSLAELERVSEGTPPHGERGPVPSNQTATEPTLPAWPKHSFDDAGVCRACKRLAHTAVLFSRCPGAEWRRVVDGAECPLPACRAKIGDWCVGPEVDPIPGAHLERLASYYRLPAVSDAEVADALREAGGDPEAIGKRGEDLARELLEKRVRGDK